MPRRRKQRKKPDPAATAERRNHSQPMEMTTRLAPTGSPATPTALRVVRSGWAFSIAVGVIVGVLIAWWMLPNSPGNAEAAQPIAVLDAPDYHSLLIDPQDVDHVLFGSHSGIQESRDGGFTWQTGSLANADAMIMAASPNAPETVYVAGHDVLQTSHDGGASWQPVAHNLPGTDIHGFAQSPADPQRLYAFVVGFGGFTSPDGGATWEPFGSQPPGSSHLVLASNGTDFYAATEVGISKSSDHGASWEPLEEQPGKVTVFSLAVSADDPQTIYVGTPIGLIRSTDGGEIWASVGPPSVPVLAIAVAPSDAAHVLVLSDEGSVYRSDDGGTTWQSPR